MIDVNVQRAESARNSTSCSTVSAKTFPGLFLLRATQRIMNFWTLPNVHLNSRTSMKMKTVKPTQYISWDTFLEIHRAASDISDG